MINTSLQLVGHAAKVLQAGRVLAGRADKLSLLLHGAPGVGKSDISDRIALELTGGAVAAIEHVNGQSLTIEKLRDWRAKAVYGNLFADWTVKRIDELDLASPAAKNELLTYLDYLPRNFAVLATTNEYGALRAASGGRLETRFRAIEVCAPQVSEAAQYIAARFALDAVIAEEIALGAVPEGSLAVAGVNMRQAVMDAETMQLLAA